MSTVDQAFSAMNTEQKRAVETIDGPVLVLAGPGTGKTQVVALRVAEILKKTQMRPSNILCITYTVSGATAMRERLRSYIGADAYGVVITTFHGFCNDLILRHPEVFHSFSKMTQISDVKKYRLLNEIIDTLPMDSVIVNPKDRHARTKDILERISEVKREGITLEKLHRACEEYESEMKEKSRPGTKVHERNLIASKKYKEFIQIYENYQSRLSEEALYDYEDMIHFVINALEQEDWLLDSLHVRHQYILVDEFQDTNGSQNRIIDLLTTFSEGVNQSPNICVVGDDDQSIYRFQGANVSNMIDFRNRFPDCAVITLTQSYRSTQDILDASMSLISHNKERLTAVFKDIQKNLVSAGKEKKGPKPLLVRPVSDAVEYFAIAEHIETFLKEGIPLSEIAVFTQTNAELFDLHAILRGRGIPVTLSGKLNLLWNSKVMQLIAMLRAIHKPLDDHLLSSAIACPVFGCNAADLGKLWSHQREKTYERYEQKKPKLPFFDVLSQLEEVATEMSLKDSASLFLARDLLFSLHERSDSLTLLDTVDSLLHHSGLVPDDPNAIAPLDLVALQEFVEHIKSRCREIPTYSIGELLNDIDYRLKYGISMNYAIPHIIEEGVQLMTAHHSKGREFEAVILTNFREKQWGNRRGRSKLALPDHLIFSSTDDETIEDERRLAYVAFTRAKKYLLLSCPMQVTRGEREQDVSPSQFFSEAGVLPEERYELKDSSKASILLMSQFTTNLDDEMKTFLKRRLETFELSPTALNKFLEDPMKFLWEEFLVFPGAADPIFAYGTAVHEALYEWGMHAKQGGVVPLDGFLQTFNDALNRSVLTESSRAQWSHIGMNALPKYYNQFLREMPQIYGLERKVTARLNEIPLKGKLDRIDIYDPNGKFLHIVDYKTGTPKTEKKIREEFNGSMHRQLVFYKLLIENSPSFVGYEVKECTLEFIGDRDNDPVRLTLQITQEEVKELKKLIEIVWDKIKNLDFTPVDLKTLDPKKKRDSIVA